MTGRLLASVPTAGAPTATEATRRFSWSRAREVSANQLFLVPVALVFVVLLVVPLTQTFYWSLTDFSGYSADAKFVGLSNYGKVLTDPSMLAGLGFTLAYTIGTAVLITAFAIPLAVVLNKKFFARNLVRSVFFFPAVPSIAILGLVWGYILSPLGSGVLNSVLDSLFGAGPYPWLSDATLARLSVIVVAVWGGMGWHAVLYLAYLQSIPADYYEVATIDGASARQQFVHITLPLLTPAIVISNFLLMTGGLKVFDLPFTLTKGGPGYSTYTITQSIITSGVAQGRYGLASALAVLFTFAVGLVAVAQLWVSRRIERRVL
ncbi:carbohydrate ABC transporter membrane protein 1 (CUT1 family) [Kribbella amoyensis]|uniref:Carbohydrate ABC transporter membrane protein 1 (CUT1 family) n=1 Tax=Kribbella amoyensis TaxID=996641 RepID=A0A561BX96_9ACTN|nr:sugar ABC transporter permease [Kribbella amoyensis]TWD83461.1 carbohydrate ABC transporter membrane protein 1 (CUT1 family) [Kribbella amoyensis]